MGTQTGAATAAGVDLSAITIRFGDVVAVKDVSLSIRSGEFFTLLGPSGCGKTTLLRAIAGFYLQNEGTIDLGGTKLDGVPAHKRDTGMVFQNYAVFPHLNVRGNIAYGLKARNVVGAEAQRRIEEALAMVDLTGLEARMPKQLSGGQQQRVVIARAIAVRPRVLLMDEPLANLDAKLRVRLRNDLKDLQRQLGITTIYVTHDQEEALSLSDRIAVMSKGEVLQVGTPEEIYAAPAELRVAEFVGEGNFLRATADSAGQVALSNGVQLSTRATGHTGDVWVGFRPQDVTVNAPGAGLTGTVASRIYLGSYVRLQVDCGLEKPVSAQLGWSEVASLAEGQTVTLGIPGDRLMVFPGTDEDVDL